MATNPTASERPAIAIRGLRHSARVFRETMAPARVLCTDAASGLIVGSPSIAPGRGNGQPEINVEEVIRLIGGTYRLASIAVDIATDELTKQIRRIFDELRLRRRLWRRRRRLPAGQCP